jgi:hypothetical protein
MDEVLVGKKDSSITCVEKENNMCKVKLITKSRKTIIPTNRETNIVEQFVYDLWGFGRYT